MKLDTYSEQDEINLRNLLVRYVHCLKIVFSLRDISCALRDDTPLSVYRKLDEEGRVAFDESGKLACMIARNPLIQATQPESLEDIKIERGKRPEDRDFFNPFLELLNTRGRFNRKWYHKDDRDIVDYLMDRLYAIMEKKHDRA